MHNAIFDLIKGNKRAIIKNQRLYYETQSKMLEYRSIAKIHPLNGTLSIDHAAFPSIGWFNQEYILTEDILKHYRIYNEILLNEANLQKGGKGKNNKKGKTR